MRKSAPLVRAIVLGMFAAFTLSLAGQAMAQGTTPAPKAHAKHKMAAKKDEMQEHMAMVTKRLNLSPDQQEKMKSIMQEHMDASKALHAKYKGKTDADSKAAMKKEHADLQTDMEAKIGNVLTPDQMTEYKKMRAEGMHHKESAKEEKAEEKGETKP